jgi:hypothetical protein
MIFAPRSRTAFMSRASGGVMNDMAASVYVASVANSCAHVAVTSRSMLNAAPSASAAVLGGTLKITPTAPESSISGVVNPHNECLHRRCRRRRGTARRSGGRRTAWRR